MQQGLLYSKPWQELVREGKLVTRLRMSTSRLVPPNYPRTEAKAWMGKAAIRETTAGSEATSR
jgi:hypothetical protein